MSLNRFAVRRDANEAEIIGTLEACGFRVEPMSEAGLPDLLLSRAGRWYVGEVKTPRGRETKAQLRTRERARAPIPIFRSADDVIAWANEL